MITMEPRSQEISNRINITGSVFKNSYGSCPKGGAIKVNHAEYSSIQTCSFVNNKAVNGGSVYVGRSVSSSDVIGCMFVNSSASKFGGSISVVSMFSNIKQCTFQNSSAKWSGGSINVASSSINIEQCIFQNSFAYSYGGSILSQLTPSVNSKAAVNLDLMKKKVVVQLPSIMQKL